MYYGSSDSYRYAWNNVYVVLIMLLLLLYVAYSILLPLLPHCLGDLGCMPFSESIHFGYPFVWSKRGLPVLVHAHMQPQCIEHHNSLTVFVHAHMQPQCMVVLHAWLFYIVDHTNGWYIDCTSYTDPLKTTNSLLDMIKASSSCIGQAQSKFENY